VVVLRLLLDRISFANVVSMVALFVALGGTALALSKNSIKSRHIAPGAVRGSDIRREAVKSSDIGNETVKGADIRDGAVGTSEIADGAVGASQIAGGAVTGEQLADGTVGVEDLGEAVKVARAYAYVTADADVVEARSFGITDANLVDKNFGHYCFYDLPFEPVAVVATAETNNILSSAPVASARLDPDSGADICTGTEDASVNTYNASGDSFSKHPFWVVFF
jgi:hypothetical protein